MVARLAAGEVIHLELDVRVAVNPFQCQRLIKHDATAETWGVASTLDFGGRHHIRPTAADDDKVASGITTERSQVAQMQWKADI